MLLCWAATWASGGGLKGWGKLDAVKLMARAATLLDVFVHECMDDGEYTFAFDDQNLAVMNRSCEIARLKELMPALRRKFAALHTVDGRLGIGDLIVCLTTPIIQHVKSREVLDTCLRGLESIFNLIAIAWEFKHNPQADEDSSSSDFIGMPILVGPKGKARRVPAGKKLAIAHEVAHDKNIPNAGAFVAVEASLKRSRSDSSLSISPKTAKRYSLVAIYGYYMEGVSRFQNIAHVNVAVDGVRAFCSKYLVSAFWSIEVGSGMWLAPQVPSFREFRPEMSCLSVFEARFVHVNWRFEARLCRFS